MRRLLVPLAAVSVLALAACGGGSSGGSASSSSASGSASTTTTHLKVGVIPIVDVAPIYLGQAKGFFKAHHIDLELVQENGGAAAVPGVVSGDFQFSFGNVTSVILAGSQNLPLKMISEGVSSTGDASTDFGGVIVPSDSSITRPKDLAGKTIAINNLKNINDVTVRSMIEKDGGDPSTVKFVELAFPDMPAAVAGHKVDAAQVVEPFLSAATAQGDKVVGANYAAAAKNLSVACYFTSQSYLQQHPAVVKDFQAAIKESLAYASAHSDEVRSTVPTYTKITADVAKSIKLPAWPQDLNVASLKTVASLMKKYDITTSTVDVTKLLATG